MQPKREKTFGDPFVTDVTMEWAIYFCAAALVLCLTFMFLYWRRKRISSKIVLPLAP